jgi:hypothetical protein
VFKSAVLKERANRQKFFGASGRIGGLCAGLMFPVQAGTGIDRMAP